MAGKKINAKEFAADFRSGLHDMELMRKYEISPHQLRQLLQKLVEVKALAETEVNARQTNATGRDPQGLDPRLSDESEPSPAPLERTDAPPGHPLASITKEAPVSRMKACPFCSEQIPADSLRCRHCDEWLDGTALGLQTFSPYAADRSQAVRKIVYGIAGQCLGSIILLLLGNFGLLVGTLLLLASLIYYMWGCCQYITSKGYHIAWGLLGFIPCLVGLLILLAMPEQT